MSRFARILLIAVAAPVAGVATVLAFLHSHEQQQAAAYYDNREILRAVYQSAENFQRTRDSKEDANRLRDAVRKAFFDKISVGTSRDEVYRRLEVEGMSCVPESNTKTHCMAIGHSNDFRWFFMLHFSDGKQLLDAEIAMLKGA